MAQIMGIAGLSGSRLQKLVFRGSFRMKNIALTTALALTFAVTPLAVLADDAPAASTDTGSGTAAAPAKKSGNVVGRDAKKVGKGMEHGVEKVGSETKKGTMGLVHGTEKVFKGVGHGVEKMGAGTKHGFEKMTGHGKKADPAAGAAATTGTDPAATPAK
jgi:hypothetical protein